MSLPVLEDRVFLGAVTVNGRPLVQTERYSVATTAFLASGRAGYKQLAALPAEKTFEVEPDGDLDALQ